MTFHQQMISQMLLTFLSRIITTLLPPKFFMMLHGDLSHTFVDIFFPHQGLNQSMNRNHLALNQWAKIQKIQVPIYIFILSFYLSFAFTSVSVNINCCFLLITVFRRTGLGFRSTNCLVVNLF